MAYNEVFGLYSNESIRFLLQTNELKNKKEVNSVLSTEKDFNLPFTEDLVSTALETLFPVWIKIDDLNNLFFLKGKNDKLSDLPIPEKFKNLFSIKNRLEELHQKLCLRENFEDIFDIEQRVEAITQEYNDLVKSLVQVLFFRKQVFNTCYLLARFQTSPFFLFGLLRFDDSLSIVFSQLVTLSYSLKELKKQLNNFKLLFDLQKKALKNINNTMIAAENDYLKLKKQFENKKKNDSTTN